jgi:hypothetical protein
VIVAYGNQIAMEETLDRALGRVFSKTPPLATPSPSPAPRIPSSIRELANKALEQFQKSQELLRQGNFGGYEMEQKRLAETLRLLREQASSLP